MMCMTVLHGGVCHRTSTPYKRGNKIKEKMYGLHRSTENLRSRSKSTMLKMIWRTGYFGRAFDRPISLRKLLSSSKEERRNKLVRGEMWIKQECVLLPLLSIYKLGVRSLANARVELDSFKRGKH